MGDITSNGCSTALRGPIRIAVRSKLLMNPIGLGRVILPGAMGSRDTQPRVSTNLKLAVCHQADRAAGGCKVLEDICMEHRHQSR